MPCRQTPPPPLLEILQGHQEAGQGGGGAAGRVAPIFPGRWGCLDAECHVNSRNQQLAQSERARERNTVALKLFAHDKFPVQPPSPRYSGTPLHRVLGDWGGDPPVRRGWVKPHGRKWGVSEQRGPRMGGGSPALEGVSDWGARLALRDGGGGGELEGGAGRTPRGAGSRAGKGEGEEGRSSPVAEAGIQVGARGPERAINKAAHGCARATPFPSGIAPRCSRRRPGKFSGHNPGVPPRLGPEAAPAPRAHLAKRPAQLQATPGTARSDAPGCSHRARRPVPCSAVPFRSARFAPTWPARACPSARPASLPGPRRSRTRPRPQPGPDSPAGKGARGCARAAAPGHTPRPSPWT